MDFTGMTVKQLIERLDMLDKRFQDVSPSDTEKWSRMANEMSAIEDWLEECFGVSLDGQYGTDGIEEWFD